LRSLEIAGAHLYGIVLNKVDKVKGGPYTYHDRYAPVENRKGRTAPRNPQWDKPQPVKRKKPAPPTQPKQRASRSRRLGVS
jgi:hypothetical protein